MRPWSVVLAGGEGARLRPLVERWLGEPRPKQYCAFSGDRTMLEHAWGRAERLSAERVITILGPRHRRFLAREGPGLTIEEPENIGTAAGVLLPALIARQRDPRAVVVTMPSDHYVDPDSVFAARAAEAAAFAARSNTALLLAAAPSSPETEYGWIVPSSGRGRLRGVSCFVEKPGLEQARSLWRSGALWNTFIVAARADVLVDLARRALPGLMHRLEPAARSVGAADERRALSRAFAGQPHRDFSRDLLEHPAARLSVMLLEGVTWSDWGRSTRILATLAGQGKAPAFPLSAAAAA